MSYRTTSMSPHQWLDHPVSFEQRRPENALALPVGKPARCAHACDCGLRPALPETRVARKLPAEDSMRRDHRHVCHESLHRWQHASPKRTALPAPMHSQRMVRERKLFPCMKRGMQDQECVWHLCEGTITDRFSMVAAV